MQAVAATHPVECHEIANGGRFIFVVGENVYKMSNEHAKLRAPIPQVVEFLDFMAYKLTQVGQAVTNNGRPEMGRKT